MDISLNHLIAYCVIAAIIYFIYWQVVLNRIAQGVAKRYCQEHGVQFLDQNVVLKRVSLSRKKNGLFAIKRCYKFEFASVGDRRYQGTVSLLGRSIKMIELEAYKTE